MKIVVDQNIPLGDEAFAEAGEVVRLAGRQIRRGDMDGCRALIVRSITKVDRSLLEGTPVRFVGTCTIGTDHLDIPWLEQNGIRWVSAPGCNARSVAEWVGAVLASAHLRRRIDLSLAPRSGVVGVGRVGRQVAEVLAALVAPPLLNDPPRALAEGPDGFVALTDLVKSCPIVCAHLPLTRSGDHATLGLLSRRILSDLPRGAVFLNAGRGPTAVSDDLLALLRERPDLTMALDVFDPEPSIPADLARAAHFISPHVAGYSLEGKLEGTRMVREALGEFLGLPAWELPPGDTAPLEIDKIRLPGGGAVSPDSDPWDALCALIQAAWSPSDDDGRLRACLGLPDKERGEEFDRLRKEYPIRREWRHRPLVGADLLPAASLERVRNLGFREA
jgi:erythronate-4-phosphate dehydrogenase